MNEMALSIPSLLSPKCKSQLSISARKVTSEPTSTHGVTAFINCFLFKSKAIARNNEEFGHKSVSMFLHASPMTEVMIR